MYIVIIIIDSLNYLITVTNYQISNINYQNNINNQNNISYQFNLDKNYLLNQLYHRLKLMIMIIYYN